jgi:NTE family protein
MNMPARDDCDIALVLSGGVALGAYQAGVYEALQRDSRYRPGWLAASSIGAVNAVLIAGSPPQVRIHRLREFWTASAWTPSFAFSRGPLRQWQNWSSVVRGRLFGAPGHFHPRLPPYDVDGFPSIYSLKPMRGQLEKLVDFGRVNGGDIRVTVVTTDIETGDMVVFDTAQGDRIEPDHVLASCGYVPEFPPIEVGGRMLGDGGLSSNAPIELVLDADHPPALILLADLFSRDGKRPVDLQTALERKSDLLFANQTYAKLEAFRARVERDNNTRVPQVVHLSYRPSDEEAGSEKTFDYSWQTLEDRWRAGILDYEEAKRLFMKATSERVISIRRDEERLASGRSCVPKGN